MIKLKQDYFSRNVIYLGSAKLICFVGINILRRYTFKFIWRYLRLIYEWISSKDDQRISWMNSLKQNQLTQAERISITGQSKILTRRET